MRWSLHKYKCLWSIETRAGVQVSRKEFHTHIHLDYVRVEFYLVLKIKIKKIKKKVQISIVNIKFNAFVLTAERRFSCDL